MYFILDKNKRIIGQSTKPQVGFIDFEEHETLKNKSDVTDEEQEKIKLKPLKKILTGLFLEPDKEYYYDEIKHEIKEKEK